MNMNIFIMAVYGHTIGMIRVVSGSVLEKNGKESSAIQFGVISRDFEG